MAAVVVDKLSVEGLACERQGQTILSGVTFDVPAGQVIVLRGPNGSGKTTLLRTLAGYLPKAAGKVAFRMAGVIHAAAPANVLHYAGHASGIKGRLTVFENAAFWQRYYEGDGGTDAVEAALDAFGLLHLAEYRAAYLSAGQLRRLTLSRILTARRSIWLLDEPSASLDAASVSLLEGAVANHLDSGGLAIVATHDDLNLPQATIFELGRAIQVS